MNQIEIQNQWHSLILFPWNQVIFPKAIVAWKTSFQQWVGLGTFTCFTHFKPINIYFLMSLCPLSLSLSVYCFVPCHIILTEKPHRKDEIRNSRNHLHYHRHLYHNSQHLLRAYDVWGIKLHTTSIMYIYYPLNSYNSNR